MTEKPDALWVMESCLEALRDADGSARDVDECMDLVGLPGERLDQLFILAANGMGLSVREITWMAHGLWLGWLLRERWAFANAEMT